MVTSNIDTSMDIKTILNIMGHYGLTSEELLLVWCTIQAREEEGHPEYFKQWYEQGGKERLKGLFQGLKDKGVILKDYCPEHYDPNDVEFNKNFLKGWFKYSLALGQELFDAYPKVSMINGQWFPLCDISKKFNSMDEFFFFYAKEIGHNVQKHREIMELLKWGIANDCVKTNIVGFVISHLWDVIRELRDNPKVSNIVTNIARDE